jgi:glyoxylase-like metal-dependent hydrolase (beta-lactamase superfamily II)
MDRIQTLDLEFLGTTTLISSYLVPADGGFALLESGPASGAEALERGVEMAGFAIEDLRAVFVTHVHLDHSGGAGTLAQRTGCTVYCHPAGKDHLVDPGRKLLPSAERLYKEMMVPLWGNTVDAPESQVVPVGNGEAVTVGDLEVRAWHTPGHAIHHVAWQIGDAVVTGDVGGVRFPGATHVLPPMPPPDIDVEEWKRSLNLLRGLAPRRLFLTHFGGFDDPARHLDELEDRLDRWTEIARRVVGDGGDAAALGARLEDLDNREMKAAKMSAETTALYRKMCPMEGNSAGLFRYCAKAKN